MSQVKGELQIKGVSVTIICEQPTDLVQVIGKLTGVRNDEVSTTSAQTVQATRRFSRNVSWTDRDVLLVAACVKDNMKTHGIGVKAMRVLSENGDYRSRHRSSVDQMSSKIRQFLRGDARMRRAMSYKVSKVLDAHGYSFGSQAHQLDRASVTPELA